MIFLASDTFGKREDKENLSKPNLAVIYEIDTARPTMISEIVHKQGPPSKDPLNNTVIAYSWMRILGV
jgi:hypothetical protein